jgi:putative Holliday junction resolvase
MARVLAIDFGLKRTGLAISDPLGMIANGLETVDSKVLLVAMKQIDGNQGFDTIVIGEPRRLNGEHSEIEQNIKILITELSKVFPSKQIERFDERFTSKIALDTLIGSGVSKKERSKKGNIDKISATLILQEYLNQKS